MKVLITGDLHLTDREQDEYRWDVFAWLAEKILQHAVDALVIVGDLTEFKDNHSSKLVNRLVGELLGLETPTHILKGNHDYVDKASPFFEFMGKLHSANVKFYSEITLAVLYPVHDGGTRQKALFLPHTRSPKKDWASPPLGVEDFIFLHQTLQGAVGENGQPLEGVSVDLFDKSIVGDAVVIAGDVHVPQRIGNVRYVGAPHPVDFGDSFQPRALLVEGFGGRAGHRIINLKRDTLKKRILRIKGVAGLVRQVNAQQLSKGDRVKLVVTLPRAEFVRWEQHKAELVTAAEGLGLVVCGVRVKGEEADEAKTREQPAQRQDAGATLREFCKNKDVSDEVRKVGMKIIEEVSNG